MTICPIIFTVFWNGGYAGISAQPFAFNLGGYDDNGVYKGVVAWWPELVDKRRDGVLIAMTVLWGIATLGLQLTCPMEFVPLRWHIPFWAMPWLPSCSLFSLTLLVGSFGGLELDYTRIGFCVLAMSIIYLFYSVHASYHRLELYEAELAEMTAKGKLESAGADAEPVAADVPEGATAEAPAAEAVAAQ